VSALLTHARQFAGPGAAPVLLRQGVPLLAHDASFAEAGARRRFEAEHPGAVALAGQDPRALADELASRGVSVETVIHNDVHPNAPGPIEEIPLERLRSAFEALLLFPAHLTQLLLPAMKRAGRGRFVFVTSARERQPEPASRWRPRSAPGRRPSPWRWRARRRRSGSR
jgi:3-oxoacyl-[acyl-carrier protein] reductase